MSSKALPWRSEGGLSICAGLHQYDYQSSFFTNAVILPQVRFLMCSTHKESSLAALCAARHAMVLLN